MIIEAILAVIAALLNVVPNVLISIFPVLSVKTLPLGMDAVLTQGVGYINFINVHFPPLGVLWEALLFVITFKLGLKLIAMIPVIRNILHR